MPGGSFNPFESMKPKVIIGWAPVSKIVLTRESAFVQSKVPVLVASFHERQGSISVLIIRTIPKLASMANCFRVALFRQIRQSLDRAYPVEKRLTPICVPESMVTLTGVAPETDTTLIAEMQSVIVRTSVKIMVNFLGCKRLRTSSDLKKCFLMARVFGFTSNPPVLL